MIGPLEQDDERDAAIDALLAAVPFPGWSIAGLQAAGVADAALLFPGGVNALIEAASDLADRRMVAAAEAAGAEGLGMTAKVRRLIVLRLEQARPHRDAVRRLLGLLAMPCHRLVAARCAARTLDAIWLAAGDHAVDFSWYSKRAILAGVYGATLLAWLRDSTEDDAATLAFLDRRLKDVGRINRLMGRLRGQPPRAAPAPG